MKNSLKRDLESIGRSRPPVVNVDEDFQVYLTRYALKRLEDPALAQQHIGQLLTCSRRLLESDGLELVKVDEARECLGTDYEKVRATVTALEDLMDKLQPRLWEQYLKEKEMEDSYG